MVRVWSCHGSLAVWLRNAQQCSGKDLIQAQTPGLSSSTLEHPVRQDAPLSLPHA